MKVYTKTGDKGQTSLFGGKRISKADLRIESYGTVDELNSWIGLLRDQEIAEHQKQVLVEVQDRLFTMGSMLASDPEKPLKNIPLISAEDITYLEQQMDKMDENLPPMKSFVLPGGHQIVSYCHISECVCRRAERMVIRLSEESVVDELVIRYLNRLSDFLFVLSRQISLDKNANETPWEPRI